VTRPQVLAFVLAGGKGERLSPFTNECPKPALAFGGGYRIVDFVLSNLYNSALPQAHVLLQYRSQMLAQHLAEHWGAVRGAHGRFVHALVPGDLQAREFPGTAGAVAAALRFIDTAGHALIAVFAADHVYRMDVRQMVAFHRERDADATVAAVPVPIGRAGAFGIISAARDGRILGFQEKPLQADAMPGDATRAYASMGNYLFRPQTLREALGEAWRRGEYDFGRHVLPRMVERQRVYAYDFARNRVPGVQADEEPAYWRDVGTVDAYVEAQWDLLGPEPRFRLGNPAWPIRCGDAPRVLGSLDGGGVEHSIIGPGVAFQGAALRRSVLQRGSRVAAGADLERCIVMGGAEVGRGVQLRDTIVGGGNTLQASKSVARCVASPTAWKRSPAGMFIVPPQNPPRGQALL
jgi:glucose-1-phosphate adenylyltransferase